MSADAAHHSVGRHLLGPHVVGQRVVVRHLLPDGRATDVLGVCTAWGEDSLTVESDHGPVVVARADLVTGKPVPPRASVRARVTPRDAEVHGLVLWPRVDTEPVGEWLLRTDPAPAERLFKRANSCLAMGDPGLPLAEAEARVREFYTSRGRPALVQVEQDSAAEEHFVASGWAPLPGGDTLFQVASLAQVARRLPRPPEDTLVSEDGPRVLVELPGEAGEVRARGRAAVDGDWLGLHALATNPAHRRRGLARAVLADLVDWGAARGATTAWLHVETDNVLGLALYDSLGFRTHHRCRYLTAATPS
jgi:N-acetylglutamate synthase